MAGETVSNYATKFQLGTGANAPYTYADVGEVVTNKPPKITSEVVESTSHSSGGKATYIPSGLIKVEDGSITVNYTSTDTFYAAVGTILHAKLLFPNTETLTFDMVVTGFEIAEADAQSPDVSQATVSYRPCTVPTQGA